MIMYSGPQLEAIRSKNVATNNNISSPVQLRKKVIDFDIVDYEASLSKMTALEWTSGLPLTFRRPRNFLERPADP